MKNIGMLTALMFMHFSLLSGRALGYTTAILVRDGRGESVNVGRRVLLAGRTIGVDYVHILAYFLYVSWLPASFLAANLSDLAVSLAFARHSLSALVVEG
jgi:hypothetical protein